MIYGFATTVIVQLEKVINKYFFKEKYALDLKESIVPSFRKEAWLVWASSEVNNCDYFRFYIRQ